MHFLGATALLFVASAFALPQFGNQNGRYYQACTCTRNGQPSYQLGEAACQSLERSFSNLYADESGYCRDRNGLGVERNGFAAACQSVGGDFGQFNAVNIDASCY